MRCFTYESACLQEVLLWPQGRSSESKCGEQSTPEEGTSSRAQALGRRNWLLWKIKRPGHHLPYPVCISAESILAPHGNLQGVTDGLFWYQSWITLVMEVEPLLPPWGDTTHNVSLPVPSTLIRCARTAIYHPQLMVVLGADSIARSTGMCLVQSTWIPSLVSLLEIQSPMLWWLLRSVNWQPWSSRPRCPTKGFSVSPISLNFSLCFLWLIPSGYDL